MVQALQDNTGLDPSVRNQLRELSNVWDRVQELGDIREAKLSEARQLAEQFNEAIQVVRNWLPEAEAELKFHSIPEDEDNIMQLIENHEKFQEDLHGQQANVDRIRYLAEEILQACHPNAVRFVKYYVTITQTRWEQALSRSNQRAIRLQETLRTVRANAALLDETMVWLADCHALLSAKEKDSIPEDLTVVEALVNEHTEFHEELSNKHQEVEKLIRSLPSISPAGKKSAGRVGGRQRDSQDVSSAGAAALQRRWQTVWRMSADRSKKLQDMRNRLLEAESIKNFDFDVWRQRYITWTRTNKLKYMDFFRRLDKEGTGLVTRKEFIDGILASKFPTTTAEVGAVFSLFDVNKTGRIFYKKFLDTIMRPDKQFTPQKPGARAVPEADQIHAQVEDELSHCQCHSQFSMIRVDDGKYKFGDKEKIWQLRLLNGSVYVRFGASVMPLDEFLASNDPCRARFTGRGLGRPGLSSRLSGSASNLSTAGKSSLSPYSPSALGGTGLAGQRNSFLAKSWSNLSTTSPLTPRSTAKGPSTSRQTASPSLSIPSTYNSLKLQRKPSPTEAGLTNIKSPSLTNSKSPSVTSSATATPPSTARQRQQQTRTPNGTTPVTSSSPRTPLTGSTSSTLPRTGRTSSPAMQQTEVGRTRLTTTGHQRLTNGQPRKSTALRSNSPAPIKHTAGLHSSLFNSSQDMDF